MDEERELAEFARNLPQKDKSKLLNLVLDCYSSDNDIKTQLTEKITFLRDWENA